VPLTSSGWQIYLSKRPRRAGGRRFRVGPIPDARVAKTNAGKSLLWCLLISGSEMLMARPRHR